MAFLAGGGCSAGKNDNQCADEQAGLADACLRDAIQLPPETPHTNSDLRSALDCAERHYAKALRLSGAKKGSARRISYHGGLLLTLSERRDRLDHGAAEDRIDRENEKLLKAAQVAREEVPDDAMGFVYGASARLFRATLSDDRASRCSDLQVAGRMLAESPTPPSALVQEQARLAELAAAELDRCSAPPAVAVRGGAAGDDPAHGAPLREVP